MTDQTPKPDDRRQVDLRYGQSSELKQGDAADQVFVSANTLREPVSFEGKIKESVPVRECLTALYDVVSSDFAYKPKDRSAYLAYQAMKKQTASASAWEARQAYFDWLERNDPDAWVILDPIVSVYPDELMFEVFSKDEGAYAVASIKSSAFEIEGKPVCGTTNIDFSKDFADAIGRMRSYRETSLAVKAEEVAIATEEGDSSSQAIEKKINLPTSWLRGLLQVQSATLMARTGFRLSPISCYNVLRQLRLNKDKKKGGRAIRIELVPNQVPRLVLEPWEEVIEASDVPFAGDRPEIIRLWGRRRLKVIAKLLSLAESIDVHVLGSGLPVYFVLTAKDFTFTLALTGFSSSNWSQGLAFDLMLPPSTESDANLDKLAKHLKSVRSATLDELSTKLKLEKVDLVAAIQSGCQQGMMLFDLETVRWRPLLDEPVSLEEMRFRNRRERTAHDLLAKKDVVTLESEKHLHDVGVEFVGKVKIAEEKREYRPLMRITPEGRVLKAECTCPFYRKHQLKEGPCEHIIATRIRYGELELDRKQNPRRDNITLETRTFTRRKKGEEMVYDLALDNKRLVKRWGARGKKMRKHAMIYNTVQDAREAYFGQVDDLEANGFVDARS